MKKKNITFGSYLIINFASIFFILTGCTSMEKTITAPKVEINKFMGDWYVVGGRFTFLEVDVHNGLETYTWNTEKQRIDIQFTYNKGSFGGPLKSIPQTGWVYNTDTGAHWKVSPFWPLKLDYLILFVSEDYSWTLIGVPNQNYVWIMARDWKKGSEVFNLAIDKLKELKYNSTDIVTVPHKW